METKCPTLTKSGMPCAAPAGPSGFCAFHDPARARERQAGRRTGGLRRAGSIARHVLDASEVPAELRNPEQVAKMLADTIGHVRTGKLESRIGATVGGLAATLLKALDAGELAERLDKLEAAIQHRAAL